MHKQHCLGYANALSMYVGYKGMSFPLYLKPYTTYPPNPPQRLDTD